MTVSELFGLKKEEPKKEEKPKKKDESIINKYMFHEIFFTGLYSFLICILFLKLPLFKKLYGYNIPDIMSAFFGLFIFIGIFNCFNARTNRLNLFANLWKNKIFIIEHLQIPRSFKSFIYFINNQTDCQFFKHSNFIFIPFCRFISTIFFIILQNSRRCDGSCQKTQRYLKSSNLVAAAKTNQNFSFLVAKRL